MAREHTTLAHSILLLVDGARCQRMDSLPSRRTRPFQIHRTVWSGTRCWPWPVLHPAADLRLWFNCLARADGYFNQTRSILWMEYRRSWAYVVLMSAAGWREGLRPTFHHRARSGTQRRLHSSPGGWSRDTGLLPGLALSRHNIASRTCPCSRSRTLCTGGDQHEPSHPHRLSNNDWPLRHLELARCSSLAPEFALRLMGFACAADNLPFSVVHAAAHSFFPSAWPVFMAPSVMVRPGEPMQA